LKKKDTISSLFIESSHLVQHLQINQQFCYLCGEPNVELEPEKPLRWQNVLIYPCLCNKMAHRDCMKNFLLQTHSFSCADCKANYAIGRSQTKLLTHITPGLITSWLGKMFICFVTIVITILLIIYVTSFDGDNGVVRSWKIGLIVLFSIVLSLLVIYIIFVVRLTVKKLRRSDIEIYCNQTEIAFHVRNSKDILQDYFDNMAQYSASDDHSFDDYEIIDFKDGNSRKGLHDPTNSSLLQTREGNRFQQRYERNLGNMENILHLQDDEEEIKYHKNHQNHASEAQDYKPNYAAQAHMMGNIGRVGTEAVALKKYSNDPMEEISSIKFDVKALANDSFHSVANIIKGEDMQSDFTKPISINQTEQTHLPIKALTLQNIGQTNGQKQTQQETNTKNNQSQNYYSQDNSNVHEFDDIEPNFEIDS